MPVERKIDPESGLVTFTVSGFANIRNLQEALAELLEDSGFQKNVDVLWDFRNTEAPAPEAQELRELVNFIDRNKAVRGAGYKVAIVVFRDLDYGLARMFEAYADKLPFDLQIFRDMALAQSWLKKNS